MEPHSHSQCQLPAPEVVPKAAGDSCVCPPHPSPSKRRCCKGVDWGHMSRHLCLGSDYVKRKSVPLRSQRNRAVPVSSFCGLRTRRVRTS